MLSCTGWAFGAVVLLILGAGAVLIPRASASVDIVDLGTLGGGTSIAHGVNDAGQVVGISFTTSGASHAFLSADGVMKDLGTLPSGSNSEALGINDLGQVVGDAEVTLCSQAGCNTLTRAVLWNPGGGMVELGTLGGSQSIAYGINNMGQIVGSSATASGQTRPFLWQSGAMEDLGGLPGGVFAEAFAINDLGEVVGMAYNSSTLASDAILWQAGRVMDLGNLGGHWDIDYISSVARAINRAGQVVGRASTSSGTSDAFLWRSGKMNDLGNLPAGIRSEATAINNATQVAGWALTPAGLPHAIVWASGTMTDLGTLPGGSSSEAFGINNKGEVVGDSRVASGELHATLWSLPPPVSKPIYLKGNYWRYSLTGNLTLALASLGNLTLHATGNRTLGIPGVQPGNITAVDLTLATLAGSLTYYDNSTQAWRTVTVVEAVAMNLTRSLKGDEAGDTNFRGVVYINVTASSEGYTATSGFKETVRSTLVQDGWTFPLAPGQVGTTLSHALAQIQLLSAYPPPPANATANTTTDYAAWEPENVTVPAGRFLALPVDSWANTTLAGSPGGLATSFPSLGGGDRTRTYYSPMVDNLVKLSFYDVKGNEAIHEDLVAYHLVPSLAAGVFADHLDGNAPLPVHFTAAASGGSPPYVYAWAFGDGDTSSLRDPVHTFARPGTYNVTVQVGDDSGQTAKASVKVTVGVAPLQLTITASPTSGISPVEVSFTSTVTGGLAPYAYAWNLGDATTGADANPHHSYTRAGSYLAKLTVTDALGTETSQAVTITVVDRLAATVRSDRTEGTGSTTVHLTAAVTGGTTPYTFRWDFGDGTGSDEANPTHTFQPGTYTVILTVNDGGGQRATGTATVTVRQNAPLYTSPLVLGPAGAFVVLAGVGVALVRRRRGRT